MAKIQFVTNELMSFYSLWQNSVVSRKDVRDKMFSAFEDKKLHMLKEVVPQSYTQDVFQRLKELEAGIADGKIATIDALSDAMGGCFLAPERKGEFKEAFNSYHNFYEQSKDIMEKNKRAIEQAYQKADCDRLARFFGASESQSSNCKCFLHLWPDRPPVDGRCIGQSFESNACVRRIEDDKNYLPDSTLMTRKIGTPYHELTHKFFRETHEKDFVAGKTTGMRQVNKILTDYFNRNPEKDCGKMKALGLAAVHEGLAACAGTYFKEKTTGEVPGEGYVWYYGKEAFAQAANQLAPKMYPMFCRYMDEGRQLDDVFFVRLSMNMQEFKEGYVQQNSSQADINGKRGLESKPVPNSESRREQKAPTVEIMKQQRGGR